MHSSLLKIWLISFSVLFLSCGSSDDPLSGKEETGDENEDKQEITVDPVTNLAAKETDKANELEIVWSNPPNTVSVEISYLQEGDNEANTVIANVRVYDENRSSYLVKLPEYGTYQIGAVAIDNYGNRSEKVTVTAVPAKEDALLSYEIIDNKLPIADPYVLYHNGKYYAYGTRINGFEVYISEDLKHWKRSGSLALPPENSWGTRWFWAPEVYYVQSTNRFYMFYSVDEHICVASATKPEGPFVQDERKPIVANEKGIDTSLFIDDDLKSIKTETLTRCISAEEPWERIQGTIAEGPSILKREDTYYLIYSANHFESKDYAVGYATASSPMGPWKKYSGNPILRRDKQVASGLVGTGHGAPFVCADGSYRYIYHAHASTTSVGPRTSYINDLTISEDGVLSIGGETIRPVVVK